MKIVGLLTLLGLVLAGCGRPGERACLESVEPLAEEVEAVLQLHRGCAADADCVVVEPDLPCADLCPQAVSDPAAFAGALEGIAGRCPDCRITSICVAVEPYCAQTTCEGCGGVCDGCAGELGQVGDGRTPSDDCWAPPAHRCSDVDTGRAFVLACPPGGTAGDCCRYDRGCLPCGWIDCEAAPASPRCLEAGDGGTGTCPAVPYGTTCFAAQSR